MLLRYHGLIPSICETRSDRDTQIEDDPLNAVHESQQNQRGGLRPFNSLGCIVCRSGLYTLPFLAEERQDALENQY